MTKQLTSILLLLVGIAASATAQTKSTDPRSIQKGSAVWGLNFNYTNHNQTLTIQEVTGTGLYGTYEDKGISQLGASGQIGWFVRNRLMLGANVDFLLQPKQYNRAVDSNATGSHLAAGILARYYVPISDKLTFVPATELSYDCEQ